MDAYFENSSNVNLDKEIRLKYIDSAKNIIQEASENDSIKIKNYFKLANRYFILLEYDKYKEQTKNELSNAEKDFLKQIESTAKKIKNRD